MKNILLSMWNELYCKFRPLIDFERRHNDISGKVKIPKSTVFYHKGIGVIIGSGVKLGENVHFYQYVTLGGRKIGGYPRIGNNVILGAYCCVLGDVFVGDDAVIGAGALVLKDVPSGIVVKGVWN